MNEQDLDDTGCEVPSMQGTYVPGTMKIYPSGRYVDPFNLSPDDIELADIIWSLSHINRFNGHHVLGYSVGYHSIRCALASMEERPGEHREALNCLMHDAAEAYLGDVIRPLKQRPEFSFFMEIERQVELVIQERFDIHIVDNPWTKEMDNRILGRELKERDDPELIVPNVRLVRHDFTTLAESLGIKK
jgi:hypothetical protein